MQIKQFKAYWKKRIQLKKLLVGFSFYFSSETSINYSNKK